MAQPHLQREAPDPHEGDDRGPGPQGPHQGARAHGVLGPQDHILRSGPKLPKGLLLDLQVKRNVQVVLKYFGDLNLERVWEKQYWVTLFF